MSSFPINQSILNSPTFVLFHLLSSSLFFVMCAYTKAFSLLLVYYQVLLARGTCYYPDRSIPPELYAECNTVSNEDNACCNTGDQCTTQGYCYDTAGYLYRGGCTDITWESPNCASECKNGTQSQPQRPTLQKTMCISRSSS